jgi:hypothetical protein
MMHHDTPYQSWRRYIRHKPRIERIADATFWAAVTLLLATSAAVALFGF